MKTAAQDVTFRIYIVASTKLRNAFQTGFLSVFVMQYLQCNSDMTAFALVVLVSSDYAVVYVYVCVYTYIHV